MKALIFLLLMTCGNLLMAQKGFRSTYDVSEFMDTYVDKDTIVLYGLGFDSITGIQGIQFVKLDTFGHVLSAKIHIDTSTILTTQTNRHGLIRSKDGGYVMTGSTFSSLSVNYLLKVNHDLSLNFLKKYPVGPIYWVLNATLLELESGGYLVVGEQQLNYDPSNIVVIKTDDAGNQIWRKTYGDDDLWEGVFDIREETNNRIVISGGLSKEPHTARLWTLEIDSLGNTIDEWASEAGLNGIWAYSLLPESSWLCATGTWEYVAQYGAYMTKPVVLRMDKNRNMMWKKELEANYGYSALTNVLSTADGNYMVTGDLYTDSGVKAVHYKMAPNGDVLWMRLDSAFADNGMLLHPRTRIYGSDLLSSGSIISVGYAATSLGEVGFVMKMSPDGCVDTLNCWPVVGDQDLEDNVAGFIYPNPFDDYLTISLPEGQLTGATYVYFYDVMGRFLRKERLLSSRTELDVGGWTDLFQGMMYYVIRDREAVLGRGKLVRGRL